jgi:3-methyladenine DNA glycosylase AlkD
MMNRQHVHRTLMMLANSEIAEHSQRFFKTGKDEYGEGDRFLGIRVPVIRVQVKSFRGLSLRSTLALLKSKWHEERLFALLMVVDQFERANEHQKAEIYRQYLANTVYINNWDLVDCSAHKIVGNWLQDRDPQRLFDLAVSADLWERRISIIATYYWIKKGRFEESLKISLILLNDPRDLIHKAVGWMLREVGNVDRVVEGQFLKTHYRNMPRTMLRYAIEKFPQQHRQDYLKNRV